MDLHRLLDCESYWYAFLQCVRPNVPSKLHGRAVLDQGHPLTALNGAAHLLMATTRTLCAWEAGPPSAPENEK